MTGPGDAPTATSGPGRLAAEYVLPLRWGAGQDVAGMTAYLAELADWVDVTVVDGSEPEVYRRHCDAWTPLVRHVPPGPSAGRNGKVRGVLTGIALSRHEYIVIADDDVRYDRAGLEAVLAELEQADLVVPQNVFSAWPWHARWDTGRQLLNRCFGGDYPGTLAARREFVADGYDPDVLFENLELMRTVAARGGRVVRADHVFVDRLPPTARHFWSQRVRQAYDSFAQPGRLLLELAVLPLLWSLRRRPAGLAAVAVVVAGLAERGRRRAGGAGRFPATAALWAPVWALERAVCAWCAVYLRVRGGVRYSGGRIATAANRRR